MRAVPTRGGSPLVRVVYGAPDFTVRRILYFPLGSGGVAPIPGGMGEIFSGGTVLDPQLPCFGQIPTLDVLLPPPRQAL